MKYSTSPAYSFTHTQRLKLPREDPLFTPGPQVYSPIKLIFKNPRTVIDHAKRIPQIKETVPVKVHIISQIYFPKDLNIP